MAGLLVGTLAFACFFVYDLNQLHQNLRCLRWLFAAGCTLLAGATAWLLFSGRVLFSPPPFWSALAWAVCAVFLFLLVYTLFFALPFGKTYIKGDSRRVCDTGVYALCRHPGFLWLAGAYLFAFLACGRAAMMCAFVLFTIYNFCYVAVQDRRVFPRLFDGYHFYRDTTPFVIPNTASVRRCLRTLRGGADSSCGGGEPD